MFKGLQFAKALQAQGHQVEVLTGFPNYPGGRLYPGYRLAPFRRETMDGVRLLRVPLYPSHDGSSVGRALNYLSFAASAAVAAIFTRRPDVVYVYHPPATVAAPAVVLKLLKNSPFVYDIQDLWPDTLAATGMFTNRRALGAAGAVMKAIYAAADHIVVLSDGFRRLLVERGVPPDKISVVRNWAHEHDQPNTGARGSTAGVRILFAGNLGAAQALDTVIDAAALLQKGGSTAEFVFLGDGIDRARLVDRTASAGLTNVSFLPRCRPDEVGVHLSAADALLVHLKDDPLFAITIPSKTQAYLRAGRPILMGVRGDAADLLAEAGAGITFEPESALGLADAVTAFERLTPEQRAGMGSAGKSFYDAELSLKIGAARFSDILEKVARSRPAGARLKRVFDATVAAIALALLSVPMAAIALMVAVKMGRPVIFRQQRPGLDGKPFDILKFRTMIDAQTKGGRSLSDDERVTAFGRFLRSTSLDELPALLNVIRGEMSLVGPRPLLMAYLPLYSARQFRRHEVRPGVTGWAQVNGRNAITHEAKFELDLWYVENRSFWLDLRILCLTVLKVFRRQEVTSDGQLTPPPFRGNPEPLRDESPAD